MPDSENLIFLLFFESANIDDDDTFEIVIVESRENTVGDRGYV